MRKLEVLVLKRAFVKHSLCAQIRCNIKQAWKVVFESESTEPIMKFKENSFALKYFLV